MGSKRNIVRHKKLNRYNRITKKYGGNRFTRRIRDLFRRKYQKIPTMQEKTYTFDDSVLTTPEYRFDSNKPSPKIRRKFNMPSWLRLPRFPTRKKRKQAAADKAAANDLLSVFDSGPESIPENVGIPTYDS